MATLLGQLVLITVTEAAPLVIKVASIDMDTEIVNKRKGSRACAIAIVTIHDGDNVPVNGVTVYGHWSGLTNGNVSAITNGDGLGQVSFTSRWVRNASGTFTFTVDSMVKEGYDPIGIPTSESITVP